MNTNKKELKVLSVSGLLQSFSMSLALVAVAKVLVVVVVAAAVSAIDGLLLTFILVDYAGAIEFIALVGNWNLQVHQP